MTEEERPTSITYEVAIEAAKHGGNVDYEGRKVRVVSISARTGMDTPYFARLDLDLGDQFVVLLGYFRGGEFIEEGRERDRVEGGAVCEVEDPKQDAGDERREYHRNPSPAPVPQHCPGEATHNSPAHQHLGDGAHQDLGEGVDYDHRVKRRSALQDVEHEAECAPNHDGYDRVPDTSKAGLTRRYRTPV